MNSIPIIAFLAKNQGTDSDPHFTSMLPEQRQAMHSEGAPVSVIDQGMYYPTATNYGYIWSGYDSPGDWDNHNSFLGPEGRDIQYIGVETENLPYLYYTPSYGYTQSLYNPYNPYIPGAMIGVDGPFVGAQQYYTIPYDSAVSSPAYFPMVVQSRSDTIANSSTDPFIDNTAPTANRADGPGLKHIMSSASPAFTPTPIGPASSQNNSFARFSEGNKSIVGATKPPVVHSGVASGSLYRSPQVFQGRGTQPVENVFLGKAFPSYNQLKVNPSIGDGLSSLGSTAPSRTMVDKLRPKFLCGKITNDLKASPNMLGEQNRGPRTNKSKHQLVVKAYTAKAGNVDEHGNITINAEQYNRDDLVLDFPNAKFFVIKSYSEDDVHKSIKYNVWSSTTNGNKKLSSVYEDAQRMAAGDSKGCPIFLFFSVNASGQFSGVAEMMGPVDFYKDMEFWQQDKWTGSFPVKWHIIKDVPNPYLRHILLENNENKPVTNSRDTQEICYKKGIEMLKLFKGFASRTSLLDDFMYYENRQKILQAEKARFLIKNYGSSFIVPVLDPPRKLQTILDLPSSEGEKIGIDESERMMSSPIEQFSSEAGSRTTNDVDSKSNTEIDREVNLDTLQIGSLTINPKQSQAAEIEECNTASAVAPAPSRASVDVVTVGSVPVNVNGLAESCDHLTVGTIPLNPRAGEHD